jgi:hypothetical protein
MKVCGCAFVIELKKCWDDCIKGGVEYIEVGVAFDTDGSFAFEIPQWLAEPAPKHYRA